MPRHAPVGHPGRPQPVAHQAPRRVAARRAAAPRRGRLRCGACCGRRALACQQRLRACREGFVEGGPLRFPCVFTAIWNAHVVLQAQRAAQPLLGVCAFGAALAGVVWRMRDVRGRHATQRWCSWIWIAQYHAMLQTSCADFREQNMQAAERCDHRLHFGRGWPWPT